jgi:hypothetical protein
MGAQDIIQGGVIYFIGIFIFLSLMYAAGAMDSSFISTYTQLGHTSSSNINSSSSTVPDKLTTGVSYFSVIFSFFVWNISFTTGFLAEYILFIRILFVWLPLTFIGIAFWYSTALSSGGG